MINNDDLPLSNMDKNGDFPIRSGKSQESFCCKPAVISPSLYKKKSDDTPGHGQCQVTTSDSGTTLLKPWFGREFPHHWDHRMGVFYGQGDGIIIFGIENILTHEYQQFNDIDL